MKGGEAAWPQPTQPEGCGYSSGACEAPVGNCLRNLRNLKVTATPEAEAVRILTTFSNDEEGRGG